MITWNYRVFKEDNGDYIIRELFYDDNGYIVGCTQEAIEPFGRSLADLTAQIEALKQALTLPILTLADVPLKQEKKKLSLNSHNISHHQVMAELGLINITNIKEVV